jgi:nicotinate-nucleotide adenylyltransferase
VVAQRPGYDLKKLHSPLRDELAKRSAKFPHAFVKPSGAIIMLEIEPVDISASMIRENLARGENVHDLLPPLVLDYIQKEGLYQGADETR